MNELAIQTLVKYMDESLAEPNLNWPKEYFIKRVYSRWAANEILVSIMDHPFMSPEDITYLFILKMMTFLYKDDSEVNLIFLVAKETAEDILFLFSQLEN